MGATGILAMLLLLTIVPGLPQQAVHATAPPSLTLDGLGVNTTCGIASPPLEPNCDAQLLTTTKGHDVIILVVMCGCPPVIPFIIDSSGLTFTRRISYSAGGAISDGLLEFYARATSPLTSDNITVVFSQSPGLDGIQALAIRGADSPAIFDRNPSIPATVLCSSVQLPCSASIETSSTMDFVIAGTAINDAGPCGLVQGVGGVPGFTTIKTNRGYGGWFEIDYATVTKPQNNIVLNCFATDPVAIILDAVSLHGH